VNPIVYVFTMFSIDVFMAVIINVLYQSNTGTTEIIACLFVLYKQSYTVSINSIICMSC